MSHFDVTRPHIARIYDYWLGGTDNFEVDRMAAEQALAATPTILPGVTANRRFLGRAVQFMAGEGGVRQFLDIGTGIPTARNTHEVAQETDPDARVVYVDNDPIVLTHARALLSGTPGTTDYIEAAPGLVPVQQWRPTSELDLNSPPTAMWGGVGRK